MGKEKKTWKKRERNNESRQHFIDRKSPTGKNWLTEMRRLCLLVDGTLFVSRASQL